MLTWLALLLIVQVGMPLAMALGRNRLIFLPTAAPGPEGGVEAFPPDVEGRLVRIRRPDGRLLPAYDARPRGLADDHGPVVLFAHGNAGNLFHRAGLLAFFARHTGVRTLLFEYSGYGGAAGMPSEQEVYRDGLAAYDHLVADGVAPGRIVLYGESLGGAVALKIASERPVAGVVLQAPFTSLSSLAWRLYPWLPLGPLLVRGAFPNAQRVRALAVPLAVVHGEEDEIIPFAEGRRLHAAAPAGAELLPIAGAGHNDLFEIGGATYLRGLGERFRRWVAGANARD
ncbi:MAG TPA: alpha/beta hydrolase [Thermoanaerobaculia bacterium]|nr:alpha/beta hydrolase [Thermoanaerobaculia bacterium]